MLIADCEGGLLAQYQGRSHYGVATGYVVRFDDKLLHQPKQPD